MPDAIGWKKACHSVLVESKVSRSDFLADRAKRFRQKPETGVGCERYYLAPQGLIRIEELPMGWGLLEVWGREIERVRASAKNLRSEIGFQNEMNLLLASLRRVAGGTADELAEAVDLAAQGHGGPATPNDDVAVLVVRVPIYP